MGRGVIGLDSEENKSYIMNHSSLGIFFEYLQTRETAFHYQ
jgi:hypothetical protein